MLTFNPHVITNNLPQIGAGLATTVGAWVASTLAGAAIGFGCALAQQACGRYVRAAIRVYIELFRGTPFLVQLFLLYYGGPSFGLTFDPLTAGVVGLALYAGAYFTEAFRSGFEAVPRGHVEAASCLGMTWWQTTFRVQLPEMTVLILPALTNLTIVLSKETAVLSIVTVPELTFVLTGIGSASFAFVETLLALSVCYLLLVEMSTWAGTAVERRVARRLA
ncbi:MULTISPECIES: amino acid ABC transporter permease [unclassified Burkholderia]|uniref:amino acid ABC transporter permease n=1 Tax=unclassified Burkholderia TaxID=2613784 RepID=UPI000F58083E|nr:MULTISPECIES: amino acid ABC transporter permease [unclassified Burkholderia]RQR46744.1 amino acid ABC transporter permease [Burkholderia sp. Bp9131]RQR79630.1 amino acid ABC transporter permease [Burkholderia sp. Bp9015]RQR90248.1 amino acid ABC transporter permease [Burkholderia sp. Bp9011]RQR99256.1 amino acid ABC transporter permease [Burkholderia sp. Bp9010]RQS01945.1 amino acid ABC transporter permease [Burkholderia sp. Bp8994]